MALAALVAAAGIARLLRLSLLLLLCGCGCSCVAPAALVRAVARLPAAAVLGTRRGDRVVLLLLRLAGGGAAAGVVAVACGRFRAVVWPWLLLWLPLVVLLLVVLHTVWLV